MNKLNKLKKDHFFDYFEEGDDTKRLTFLLLIFAFLLCPLFAFLFHWIGAPQAYFYAVFSGTFAFPLILVIEKVVPIFKNKMPILYFIFFNIVTFYVIYDLGQKKFLLFDFCFFIACFSILNFATQRFYLSLIYFINTFTFLLIIHQYFGKENDSIFNTLFILFTCIGVFFLVVYYSRNKMINTIEDNNRYLKKIVNNLGHGIILFQIRGNFISVIDFNKEIQNLFQEDEIEEIESLFSKLFDLNDLKKLLILKEDEFLYKEFYVKNAIYLDLKLSKLALKNGEYFISTVQDVTIKKNENVLVVENEKKYKNLFIRNQTGVFTLNIEGKIIDCNPAFLEIFKKENVEQINIFSKQNEWKNLKEELLIKEKIINYKSTFVNEFDVVFYFMYRFYFDFEKNQIEGNVMDITEITTSTIALEEKEKLYRLIYEESNDSILLLDEDRIIDINQKGVQLLGKERAEITEKSFWDFTYNQSPGLKEEYLANFKELKENKQIKFPWIFAKNNTYIETSVSIVALSIGGDLFYQCVIRDETNRNKYLKSLQQSKQTFESIIENTPEGFIILKDVNCLYVNSEFFRIFNIEKIEANLLQFDESFFGLNYPKFQKLLEEHQEDKLIKQKQLKFFVDGKSIEIDLTIVSIVFNDEEATLLILKNVSFQNKLSKEVLRAEIAEETNKRLEQEIEERKKAELKLESEYLRTNAIFDSSQNTLLLTLTPELNLSSFNKQSKIYFDYQTNKELELNVAFENHFQQIISPIKLRYFRYLVSALRKGKSHQLELKIINVYNEKKWLELYLNPIKDIYGNICEFSLVAHDITEKKNTEKKILQSLKEKEVLLKEVHHRVKNNLQIISSILNLQSSYINDEKILEILEESRHRIRSMAIIHENLYQTTNFSSINFKNYSRELVRNLISSYQFNKHLEIELVENVDLVDLSLDQAIPLGLIINEIITNSMKYAFDNMKKGKIYLELKEKNNNITIVVGDNGIGLPKDFDINKSDTLGLQLVITLVEQLDGKIKLENKKGIKYFITFEKQNL
ncbi:MAG: histidine kinase dimerization/phosphoacceptor domain -containing protein [Bacteroidota bacterium]